MKWWVRCSNWLSYCWLKAFEEFCIDNVFHLLVSVFKCHCPLLLISHKRPSKVHYRACCWFPPRPVKPTVNYDREVSLATVIRGAIVSPSKPTLFCAGARTRRVSTDTNHANQLMKWFGRWRAAGSGCGRSMFNFILMKFPDHHHRRRWRREKGFRRRLVGRSGTRV